PSLHFRQPAEFSFRGSFPCRAIPISPQRRRGRGGHREWLFEWSVSLRPPRLCGETSEWLCLPLPFHIVMRGVAVQGKQAPIAKNRAKGVRVRARPQHGPTLAAREVWFASRGAGRSR